MTNPFKFTLSYLLILKAGSFQGKREFKKAIQLAHKAKGYSPTSKIILKASYLLLCDDYCRIEMYDQAIEEAQNAIKLFPEEIEFQRLMVQALMHKGEAIDKSIPHIRKYLNNYEKEILKIPKIYSKFIKNINFDEYEKHINSWNNGWAIWAQDTLNKFESNRTL